MSTFPPTPVVNVPLYTPAPDDAPPVVVAREHRSPTRRDKDLATVGEVRDMTRRVADELLEVNKQAAVRLGDAIASLGGIVEDESKLARDHAHYVEEALGGVRVRLAEIQHEAAAAHRALTARLDEIDGRIRAINVANLAAHSEKTARLTAIETWWLVRLVFAVRRVWETFKLGLSS